jgi:hypothetical protein
LKLVCLAFAILTGGLGCTTLGEFTETKALAWKTYKAEHDCKKINAFEPATGYYSSGSFIPEAGTGYTQWLCGTKIVYNKHRQ